MQIGGFSGTLKTGSVGSEEKALARNDVGVEILLYEDRCGEKDNRAEEAVARERMRLGLTMVRLGLTMVRLGLTMVRLATWRAERKSDWIVVVIFFFFCVF